MSTRPALHLVPAIADKHTDPVVVELVRYLPTLYDRRRALDRPLVQHGREILPAFPEFLRRPPHHRARCPIRRRPPEDMRKHVCDCPRGSSEFDGRRADGFAIVIRTILAAAACCDWRTMRLCDPAGGNLSAKRLAELAELPNHHVYDERPRRRNRVRMTALERALRAIRHAMVLPWTKQQREELPNGSHRMTGPAERKLSVSWMLKLGGRVADAFRRRRTWLEEQARRQEEKFRAAGAHRTASPIELPPAVGWRPEPRTPAEAPVLRGAIVFDEHTEAVAKEHPEWNQHPNRIFAEAARRRSERGPPGGSSGEPPNTN